MAKFTPIRITQNDRKEYARLVRNTRAKIRRTERNYGINLEGEVHLPTSIDEFKTRKEFNKWKQEQQSFTNRHNLTYQYVKNPYGVVASKKQINKIERDTRRAQNVADREIEKHLDKPVHHHGEQYGTVRDRTLHMSRPDVTGVNRPKDFNFDEVRSPQRLKDVEESMERRSYPDFYDWRKEQMKMNYMSMLEKTFNSDADELIDELADIPPEDFFDLYLQYPNEFDFNLYYPLEGEDEARNGETEINRMMEYVQKYKNGELNDDLKGF